MKFYKKYITPYLPYFILGPIFMCVEVVGDVFMPKMMSLIINVGIQGGAGTRYIIIHGIYMALTAIAMMVGGVLGAYFATKASVFFAADLRKDLFQKVQTFSFANIETFSTGSLVTRLTNDITNMQNVVAMALRMMLRSPGLMIGGLIMSFSINSRLALVFVIALPILIVSLTWMVKTAFPRFTIMQTKIDALNSRIQENLTNVRVVKSFVREDYEKETFQDYNNDLTDNTLRAFKIVIFSMPIMMLAMNVTTLAIVWFGGNLILAGNMAIGDLTAFTSYVMQILMSLMMISFIFIQGSRALASSKRIKEVMSTTVDLTDDDAKNKDATVTRGDIEFKNVSFRYSKNNQKNVLEHIHFHIPAGSVVGIIGSTGSGKTSLVQLIPRLYDVDEGEVLVDGINVKDYSLEHLRNSVAMVLQKNTLFSGSILDNLRWGDENASEEEVKKAAAHAKADVFIEGFEDGYDMELGQGGVNVSGGQKQRICIARALLKKPKILILDDSTSAVDTVTEADIRKNLNLDLPSTTKIIIAQRISSVEQADIILVMDDGKIVGMGNHHELLESNETYQEIYDSQMDKEVSA